MEKKIKRTESEIDFFKRELIKKIKSKFIQLRTAEEKIKMIKFVDYLGINTSVRNDKIKELKPEIIDTKYMYGYYYERILAYSFRSDSISENLNKIDPEPIFIDELIEEIIKFKNNK